MDMTWRLSTPGNRLIPLAILLERADAVLLAHGPAAPEVLLRQIETAVREGEDPHKVRELDHLLQLVEYRERRPGTRMSGNGDSAAAFDAPRLRPWDPYTVPERDPDQPDDAATPSSPADS